MHLAERRSFNEKKLKRVRFLAQFSKKFVWPAQGDRILFMDLNITKTNNFTVIGWM